jgi:sulfate permease, SulP family
VNLKPALATALSRGKTLLPEREHVRADLLAGLPGAISSVPDGMAASVLVGVSPVHGLYASMAGPVAGGLTSSTRLMVVTTTSAAALAAGSALSGLSPQNRDGALTLLTLVAGAAMVAAGLLRAGRYTRFVSHSVMTGFLTGVSLNIIFGQIPDILGVHGTGAYNLAKAINALSKATWMSLPSLLTGLAAAALIVTLARTRFAPLAAIVAVAVPTVVVVVFDVGSVVRVSDSGAIPRGLPTPALPSLHSFSFSVLTGALAVAAIILVQGAGVAQSAPNPGGSASDPNRDFIGQGVGNIASSLVSGQPVGGSVGQTALNVSSGAKTRWAGIFSGLWMLVILVAFSGVIGEVAKPTLAGLLIVAGIGSISIPRLTTIFRTSAISRTALITTLVATIFLPVAAAVGIGVALSLILQLNREALDLRLVELVPTSDGRLSERPAPKELTSESVTMLDVYGSLLYAGSRTLQVRLPDPADAERPAVVIRLRGRTELGATFFLVVDDYAERLAVHGGRLFLSGVDPSLLGQFTRAGGPGAERIVTMAATDVIGESSMAAYDRASQWITRNR